MCKALTPFPGIPLPSSMRLIRAQLIPNHNHGLRKLLQPLVGEVCEGRGSAGILTHRCGRFFSTVAVASDDDAKNVQRGNKRLPKHERRIMVESFVNEYRSLNGGKFPTISDAQKEVGGSFYIIREIMQALKYNVHNPKSLVERKGAEDITIPKQKVSRDQEVSCSHADVEMLNDNVEMGAEKTADLEVSEEVDGLPLSESLEGDLSTISERIMCKESERVTIIGHADHLSDDVISKDFESRKMLDSTSISERTSMEDTENPRRKEDKDEILARSEGSSSVPLTSETVLVDEKDAKSGEGLVKPSVSTSNTTDDHITPKYDGSRETSNEKSKDVDAEVSPSIWSNIKSFADSIFSSWRKR